MKPIQIMMDDDLLKELDKDEAVLRFGRSAVFRRIVSEYLNRRKKMEISNAYKKAYSDGKALDDEFAGWEDEGVWPEA